MKSYSLQFKTTSMDKLFTFLVDHRGELYSWRVLPNSLYLTAKGIDVCIEAFSRVFSGHRVDAEYRLAFFRSLNDHRLLEALPLRFWCMYFRLSDSTINLDKRKAVNS